MFFRDGSGLDEIEVETHDSGLLVTICDGWTCQSHVLSAEATKRLYDAIGEELANG